MSVDLHHVEQGSGAPILCIHGTAGSLPGWRGALETLAGLGRVIAYDRRGCGRSPRPDPYPRTSVPEHAADAAALLRELDAAPAVVIGRSYGATVGLQLAVREPELVRALVLLEGDGPRELAPGAARWVGELGARLRAVGPDGAAEALIGAIAGPGAWAAMSEERRADFTANGPAIVAEMCGEWWLDASQDELAALPHPALLVTAEDSGPELREPTEALAALLPHARSAVVAGGHMIDPAAPEVLAFVEEVLAGGYQTSPARQSQVSGAATSSSADAGST